MRCLLLLAVLATACDQGADAAPPRPVAAPALEVAVAQRSPAAPPYVVRDDADFGLKAIAVLREMGDLFADRSVDCELVATRVESFAARNATRLSVLMEYGKAHPGAEKALQGQFKPQTDELIQRLMPTVTACASNQRLMNAFQRFSDHGQLQQRPR